MTKNGFTLTEALVVFCVAASAVFLFPPVFGRAVEENRGAGCANILRLAGQAFAGYINDFDGWFPQIRTPSPWHQTLSGLDYAGPPETAFRCPADPAVMVQIHHPSYGALWGDSVLNYPMAGRNPRMPGYTSGTDRYIPARVDWVPTPGRTLVIADTFHRETEQRAGIYRVTMDNDGAGVFGGRHDGMANVLMVSGSVAPYRATVPRENAEDRYDLNVWRRSNYPAPDNWRRKTDPGVSDISPGWRIGYLDW